MEVVRWAQSGGGSGGGGTGVTELTLSNTNRDAVLPANYAEQDFINLVFGLTDLSTDHSIGTAQFPTSYFGNSNFDRQVPVGDNQEVEIGWTASTRTLRVVTSNRRFYSATLFSVGGSGSGGGDTIDAASLAAVLSVAKPDAQDVIDATWIPVLAQAKISGLQAALNAKADATDLSAKQDKLPDGTEENTALVWDNDNSEWVVGVFPAGGGTASKVPSFIRAGWFGGGRVNVPAANNIQFSNPIGVERTGVGGGAKALMANGGALGDGITFTAENGYRAEVEHGFSFGLYGHGRYH